ncbi:hypothetical protein P7K49_038736 [Saguinus oedipus]|uniref:Uncharacterized protein n=1 Tax=Saguinus oedipus TaxID=9490 RepID=A0ABQ9TG49_SAGOE|nr:hypothetical protein P7K49_038736 [Saguinus oedipus]
MQSPFAAPGPQHGIAHPALAAQTGIGGAPALNPLQQNHLLTNRRPIGKIGYLYQGINAWESCEGSTDGYFSSKIDQFVTEAVYTKKD